MDLNSFAQSVHESGLAEFMRSSLKAMPIVESIRSMADVTDTLAYKRFYYSDSCVSGCELQLYDKNQRPR